MTIASKTRVDDPPSRGEGGVKIVTTDPTGKIGAGGCSFVCRRRSPPKVGRGKSHAVQRRGGREGQVVKKTRKTLTIIDAATSLKEA